MTDCNWHSGPYFNYGCYNKLKKYYDRNLDGETAEKFLKEKHNIPPEIEKHFTTISKFLLKLGIYLVSYGPWGTSKNMTCPYINYLINLEIENKYGIDDKNYKYFCNFADEIAKYKFGDSVYTENTCSGYFSYLKDNTNYPVMKALYNIYDLFTKIKEPYTLTKDQKCSNFRSIDLYYKELIRQNQNDLELHDKLLDFRKIVLNERDNHKVPCGSSISYIMPEQESILPKRSPANSAVEGEKLLSKDPPESSAANELEPEVPVSTHPPKPESRREEDISELKKQAEESLTTEETSLGGHSGEHVEGEHVEGEQQEDTSFPNGRHNEHSHLREFQRKQLPQAFPRNERLDEMNGHIDGINYQSQDSYIPPSQQEGFMDSIKGTFAGIVQSVDPGPVLGVSGGMGALFILFKYTPFGSFFGGRRRRMHQIPRTFGGFPPGEFPNFHEYDGGFIGYAPMNINPLAE
ncbi:VIR protein [Plasmodium vivax]|uniref:VIR protein n=1 Tax=Plasmodium vivax TaxID=5855 RepID=A0A1G4EDQ3_PLAVI|nr:VIR protein [Plasmodium vivax]